MPNFGKGKSSHGVSLEDMVVGPIRSAGKVVRDSGECAEKSLAAVASSALSTFAGVAQGAADILNGSSAENVTCVKVQYNARIRIPTEDEDRVPGGINQVPCPEERAARCGRSCIRTLGGNPGFPTDRLGSAYAVSKGDNTSV